MAPSIPLPARLSGAVWGHLVGDAMGVPYEFREPEQIGEVRWGERGTHGKPPGTWSDDGALMLALLDSLLSGGFDTDDQGRRALAWWREGAYTPDGKYFDIGNATSEALARIESGTPAEEAGRTHGRSASNGSLMRILPLALWGRAQKLKPGELVDLAMRASRVTHGHPVPQVACAVYTLVVTSLLGGASPARALETAIDRVRAAVDGDLASALDEFVAWPKSNQPEGRGGAVNAFWSAWAAFRGARSYRGTIERAIRFGHDTDTTACIAGGLAGARWGIDGIPAEWRAGMRGADIVAPLVDGLIAGNGWRTSASVPIRVDWVDLSKVDGLRDAPGRLGMTFLPGKQYLSTWSGAWWRDLDRDVSRLRSEFGTDLFLLLVEDHELELTRTTNLAAAMSAAGIELVRHPVVDMNVPVDRAAYRRTLDGLREAIAAGRTVVVACRGGLGRTGTAVACLLVDAGMDADAAIALTRASRKNTIERGGQVNFVFDWIYRGGRSAIQRTGFWSGQLRARDAGRARAMSATPSTPMPSEPPSALEPAEMAAADVPPNELGNRIRRARVATMEVEYMPAQWTQDYFVDFVPRSGRWTVVDSRSSEDGTGTMRTSFNSLAEAASFIANEIAEHGANVSGLELRGVRQDDPIELRQFAARLLAEVEVLGVSGS